MESIKYRHFNDIIVADANDLIEFIGEQSKQSKAIEIVNSEYDSSVITSNYLTYFTLGTINGPFFKVGSNIIWLRKMTDRLEGEITRVFEANNTLRFERYNEPDLRYKPSLYSHTVIVYNSQVEEQMIFEMYLNTHTPPTIDELKLSRQLFSNFGVAAFHVFNSGNDEIIKSARFVFDGTNFVYWDDNTTTQVDWKPENCSVVSDDVVDLLNVYVVPTRTQKTINAFLKKR